MSSFLHFSVFVGRRGRAKVADVKFFDDIFVLILNFLSFLSF